MSLYCHGCKTLADEVASLRERLAEAERERDEASREFTLLKEGSVVDAVLGAELVRQRDAAWAAKKAAEADRDTYSREAGIFAAEAQVWEQKCAAAEAALEEARGVLLAVEWAAMDDVDERYCPSCCGYQVKGHTAACALAAALSPGAAPREGR